MIQYEALIWYISWEDATELHGIAAIQWLRYLKHLNVLIYKMETLTLSVLDAS